MGIVLAVGGVCFTYCYAKAKYARASAMKEFQKLVNKSKSREG